MLKILRYLYFPILALATSIISLPICILRPTSYKNAGFFLKMFSALSKPLGLTSEIFNKEILDKSHPSILVGNHQHNLDLWVLSRIFTNKVVSLGKREIVYIPIFGLVFWLTGNISIKRGSKESTKKSLNNVKRTLQDKKISVVIFPEGTRNTSTELLPFKNGAFRMAISLQLPITLFAISRYAKDVNFNKVHAGHVKMSFLEPISTVGMTLDDMPQLAIDCRNKLEAEISRLSQ